MNHIAELNRIIDNDLAKQSKYNPWCTWQTRAKALRSNLLSPYPNMYKTQVERFVSEFNQFQQLKTVTKHL